ncbi:hypothetical protein CK203_020199 [Vitis vinifera]|uniref:Retrotransposon Copia-like N-terminal domain-containing protein n=1 Tax=Vitis vinifera TaxID=29760 RepID=A0A438J862_VITVI|nr:hypothetical protein CK203_020199 [Vitis vinifera]
MTKTTMTGVRGGDDSEATSVATQNRNPTVTTTHGGAENLILQITIHKLNGWNFLQWSQFVKLFIKGKGKLGYLTGATKMPKEDDAAYHVWDTENSMVMPKHSRSKLSFVKLNREVIGVTQYYNILQNLWQELDLFSKVKRKCTEYSAHYCKLLKKECAFEFLMGHNKELDEVRGRVLGKEPMPSICKIFVEVHARRVNIR